MSWNPKAFFGTQIECQHVWFISVSGTQFKIHNFSLWRVHFKLWICSREPYLLLRTWTSKLFTSFSKITLGAIITDIGGERVKHVKYEPRNNDKAAHLNIKRSKDGIRKLFGFTLENISISQTWTRERVAPGHYIFPRCKKMDFNSQCLTLELSMKLSRSFQASYTIKSHVSVDDLKHVLKNSGSTTTGQISCLLQWLENLPICLKFVLEKGKAVITLFPNTTGQLQDLKDCSKEP